MYFHWQCKNNNNVDDDDEEAAAHCHIYIAQIRSKNNYELKFKCCIGSRRQKMREKKSDDDNNNNMHTLTTSVYKGICLNYTIEPQTESASSKCKLICLAVKQLFGISCTAKLLTISIDLKNVLNHELCVLR